MSAHNSDRKKFLNTIHKVLEGDNSLSKCCAVRALARIGAKDVTSKQQLIALLRDPDPDVRVDAAVALGEMRVGKAVEPLLESVTSDPDGEVRIQAVVSISKLGSKKAVDQLIQCVREDGYPELDLIVDDLEYAPCWEVQSQALNALGHIGDKRAAEAVIEFLQGDDYEDLQETGFRVLAQLDNPKTNRFLMEKLADGGRLARRRAARALGRSSELNGGQGDTEDVVPGLVEALLDEDSEVRIAAVQALGKCQNPAVAVSLAMLLNDPEPQVRQEVARVLGSIRRGYVVERLHALLDEARPETRRDIVQLLGEIGDPASHDTLVALLDTQDEDLLYEVMLALGKIGQPGAEQQIAEILANAANQYGVRVQAAFALGHMLKNTPAQEANSGEPEQITEDQPEADTAQEKSPQDILLEAAFDQKEQVAIAALSALVEADPKAAPAILTGLLKREIQPARNDEPCETDAPVRENPEIEKAIGKDPESSTLAAILARSEDTPARRQEEPEESGPDPRDGSGASANNTVLTHAAKLLGSISDPGPQAVAALMEAAETAPAELRREALIALGQVGGAAAMPVILLALEAGQLELRLAALEALERLGAGKAALSHLIKLLDDPEPAVRERTLGLLGSLEGVKINGELIRVLDDTDMAVCRAALRAFSGEFQSPELQQKLLDLVFRFSGELRQDVGAVLQSSGSCMARSSLQDMLDDPEHEDQHWICVDVLAAAFAD
ncbi:MAG: HEAT repeat domain-containing protein, partial [Methyloligellaceae bacterium]